MAGSVITLTRIVLPLEKVYWPAVPSQAHAAWYLPAGARSGMGFTYPVWAEQLTRFTI